MIRDIKGTQDFELSREKLAPYVTPYQEEEHKIINITPDMSATDINNLIGSSYKDLKEYKSLTLQFADGSYNLDKALQLYNFRGYSWFYIQGNMTENQGELHSNQAVIINFTNKDDYGILIGNNRLVAIWVRNLKLNRLSNSNNNAVNSCVYVYKNNSTFVGIWGNHFTLQDTYGYGVNVDASTADVKYNYFTAGNSAIYAFRDAIVFSGTNQSLSTQPQYGLTTLSGGRINKYPYQSQPQGSVANENEGWGTGGIS